jgi:hypothetical protein
LWDIIDDIYTESQEVVRWKGVDSRPYQVRQGVRQGGILSPILYKLYINGLLTSLEKNSIGMKIGTSFVGAPTCADDILLISSDRHQLQTMVDMAFEYSTKHRYEIHPEKSLAIHQIRGQSLHEVSSEALLVKLGDKNMKTTHNFTHLGLEWRASKTAPDVEKKIDTARRSSYALLGIGLHGYDGLDPAASNKLITTYILPRILHGLDASVLSRKQIHSLDQYYRSLLRQIQGLPENTATEAIYILLHTLPIEAALDKRVLSLFGNISRLGTTNPVYQLMLRQLACKEEDSNSWFAQAVRIGNKYGIDVRQMAQHPWPKLAWKKYTNTLVEEFWWNKILQEAKSKTTLKWMITDGIDGRNGTSFWKACMGKTYQVRAATTRARMLVGRYQLQATAAKIYKTCDSPLCLLCGEDDEDISHLICNCTKLQEVRASKVEDFIKLFRKEGLPPPSTTEELTMAILNGGIFQIYGGSWHYMGQLQIKETVSVNKCTNMKDHTIIKLNKNLVTAQQLANLICQKLHEERDILLNNQLLDRRSRGGSPD